MGVSEGARFMDPRRLKFLLLGGGVLLSFLFLGLVARNQSGGMVYYLTVTELLERQERPGKDFRVSGTVEQGSIVRSPTGIDVRFRMTDGESTLPVSYHGVVPDAFVDEAAVVVEGTLQPDGAFVAHTLLAKCPSKYEAAETDSGGVASATDYD
jgi:cytochrome c-type biogenesis protein CcmE